jgi:hypothetical protein
VTGGVYPLGRRGSSWIVVGSAVRLRSRRLGNRRLPGSLRGLSIGGGDGAAQGLGTTTDRGSVPVVRTGRSPRRDASAAQGAAAVSTGDSSAVPSVDLLAADGQDQGGAAGGHTRHARLLLPASAGHLALRADETSATKAYSGDPTNRPANSMSDPLDQRMVSSPGPPRRLSLHHAGHGHGHNRAVCLRRQPWPHGDVESDPTPRLGLALQGLLRLVGQLAHPPRTRTGWCSSCWGSCWSTCS